MNKITISENYYIIIRYHEKDRISLLFDDKIIKGAKAFNQKSTREEILKWGYSIYNQYN